MTDRHEFAEDELEGEEEESPRKRRNRLYIIYLNMKMKKLI